MAVRRAEVEAAEGKVSHVLFSGSSHHRRRYRKRRFHFNTIFSALEIEYMEKVVFTRWVLDSPSSDVLLRGSQEDLEDCDYTVLHVFPYVRRILDGHDGGEIDANRKVPRVRVVDNSY